MCYRPGGSAWYLLKSNGNGMFSTVYNNDGIADYDLYDTRDRIISLDYNYDGFSDIILYRPRVGCAYTAKSDGIGNYTLEY
ncbi:MAG: hypothetical protein WC780_08785 [Lentimicrobiaceae bacterium]|jgi:hypothetical protein